MKVLGTKIGSHAPHHTAPLPLPSHTHTHIGFFFPVFCPMRWAGGDTGGTERGRSARARAMDRLTRFSERGVVVLNAMISALSRREHGIKGGH